MGYFYNASLACVMSHPEVITETDVFVMRSATSLDERVVFILSGASSPDHWPARYDVSGVPAERIQERIETDWKHLLREKRVLNSPNYLRENGKPVVAIWISASMTATTHPNLSVL